MTPSGEPVEVEHDQTIFIGEMRIAAELGIAQDLGLAVVVPLRTVDTAIRYVDDDGQPVAIADDDVHHRNETLTGIVDPWLLAHRRLQAGRYTLDLRGGLSVPLGEIEDNPFTPEAETMPHQHVQFGTGTFNPILGIEFGTRHIRGHVLTQQVLYENERGYMAGDRYAIGLSAWLPRWGFRWDATNDLQIESAEQWDGVEHTDDGNRGRVDFLIGAGIGRTVVGLDLHLGVKLPVYTHVVGGQLDASTIVDLGISRSFDLFAPAPAHEPAHEHAHDHDHDHDHAPPPAPATAAAPLLDIKDLAHFGEAVPLTPAAGKITVFDFWAPWCAPCHDLDRMLRALADRHPRHLAVRRINVVDWDTPAAERYLTPGGFNLPHIKVVSPDGRLLVEKTAPPHDLVRDLEALLPR